MKHISTQRLLAFSDQLSKEADLKSYLASRLGGFGGRALLGAGAGAAVGAGTAEEGEGLKRGVRGAMLGAGLGLGSKLLTRAGRQEAATGLGNFAKRQRYGVTGGGGIKSVEDAKQVGLLSHSSSPADVADFQKGYQNVPGVLRGLKKDPKDLLRSGWNRGGTLGKVFTGLGAVETGKALIDKPEEGGPGRFEKALGAAGGTLGYMVAPSGILPSLAMGGVASTVASKAGRLRDRMTGHKRSLSPAPQAAEGNVG